MWYVGEKNTEIFGLLKKVGIKFEILSLSKMLISPSYYSGAESGFLYCDIPLYRHCKRLNEMYYSQRANKDFYIFRYYYRKGFYDFSRFSVIGRQMLFNGDYSLCYCHDLEYFIKKNFNESFFFRPDSGEKEIDGSVIKDTSTFFSTSKTRMGLYAPCIVASEKKPYAEARCLVVREEMRYCSVYYTDMEEYKKSYEHEIRKIVEESAKKYSPDTMFFVDIAFDGESWKIMEYSSVTFAGLYPVNSEKDKLNQVKIINDFYLEEVKDGVFA